MTWFTRVLCLEGNQSVPLLGTGTHTSSPFNMVLYNICFFVILSVVWYRALCTHYLVPRIILPGTGTAGSREKQKEKKTANAQIVVGALRFKSKISTTHIKITCWCNCDHRSCFQVLQVNLSFFVPDDLLTNAILAKLFSLLFSPPSCLCFLKTPDATRHNICQEHHIVVLTNQSSGESTHILDGVVWQWSGSLKRNMRDMETKETEEETNQRTTCQFFLLFFKTKKI